MRKNDKAGSVDKLLRSMQPVRQTKAKEVPLMQHHAPFSPKQQEFYNTQLVRLNILEGAVRSGKTYISLFKWAKFVRECPHGAELIMAGRTLTTLRRNVLDLLRTIVGSNNMNYSIAKKEAIIYGHVVYLEGANDGQAEDKIRGMTVYGAYIDEITIIPKSFFVMMLSRLSVPGAILLGTTNPDSQRHWLYREYLTKADLDLKRWCFVMDDNPSLATDFKAKLKREYTGLMYDRMILGRWVNADGCIYRQFSRDKHVITRKQAEEILSKKGLLFSVAGGDFGGNKSATTLYNTAYTRNMECVIVMEEYYNSANEDSERIVNDFVLRSKLWRTQYKLREMMLDSAETLMIRTIKRQSPVYVQGSLKTRVNDRIKLVQLLLSHKRMLIVDECTALIDALESAVWDSKQPLDVRLDDGTTNIDSLDALEYSLEKYARKLMR